MVFLHGWTGLDSLYRMKQGPLSTDGQSTANVETVAEPFFASIN
jgi:hypothetical protein